MMLSVGKNIASSADALAKMPVDYLYHSLQSLFIHISGLSGIRMVIKI